MHNNDIINIAQRKKQKTVSFVSQLSTPYSSGMFKKNVLFDRRNIYSSRMCTINIDGLNEFVE